eukprot:364707-Chlamydomonas_euryale.AAC.26
MQQHYIPVTILAGRIGLVQRGEEESRSAPSILSAIRGRGDVSPVFAAGQQPAVAAAAASSAARGMDRAHRCVWPRPWAQGEVPGADGVRTGVPGGCLPGG